MKIQLLDGREVYLQHVGFNRESHRFTYLPTGEDLTFNIKRQDARQFPGFDDTQANLLIAGHSPQQGTSTFGNLLDQLVTDPLGAPLDAADKGTEQVFGSFAVKSFVTLAIIGGVAALFVWMGGLARLKGALK